MNILYLDTAGNLLYRFGRSNSSRKVTESLFLRSIDSRNSASIANEVHSAIDEA